MKFSLAWLPLLFLCLPLVPAAAQEKGVNLQSIGPIAFGPPGVLLVSDPLAARIYAIETGYPEGSAAGLTMKIDGLKSKIAGLMGAPLEAVQIIDLAVDPNSGRVYLAVSRGSGEEAVAAIMTIAPQSQTVAAFELADKTATYAELPNPAESRQVRGTDQRMLSVTDLAFVDEYVYVAGLSNEEFASNLRSLPYPFTEANRGSSVEVYHGAHGQFETRSPIRTFAAYQINDELNLLAAYTCTPLVRIPVSTLKPESKVRGTTIAELGNRNRPLDMVVYSRDGHPYALMANSSRGVMKIDLAQAGSQEAITTPVEGGGTAGVPYETIEDLEGVVQLAGLNSTHAVVLIQDGAEVHLKTILLP